MSGRESTAPAVMAVTEVQRAYLHDLGAFEADGWTACRIGGRVVVQWTPTGVQTYVHRQVVGSP